MLLYCLYLFTYSCLTVYFYDFGLLVVCCFSLLDLFDFAGFMGYGVGLFDVAVEYGMCCFGFGFGLSFCCFGWFWFVTYVLRFLRRVVVTCFLMFGCGFYAFWVDYCLGVGCLFCLWFVCCVVCLRICFAYYGSLFAWNCWCWTYVWVFVVCFIRLF